MLDAPERRLQRIASKTRHGRRRQRGAEYVTPPIDAAKSAPPTTVAGRTDRLRAGGESIGLATVYRVLTQFEQAGLVIRHNFDGGSAVFELAAGEHHDHLVCVRCNRVTEFVDHVIEERQRKIAVENGFAMTDHSLVIHGICSDCQRDSD